MSTGPEGAAMSAAFVEMSAAFVDEHGESLNTLLTIPTEQSMLEAFEDAALVFKMHHASKQMQTRSGRKRSRKTVSKSM